MNSSTLVIMINACECNDVSIYLYDLTGKRKRFPTQYQESIIVDPDMADPDHRHFPLCCLVVVLNL